MRKPPQAALPPALQPDTFFDMTLRGRIPDILRQLANRIDSQEVSVDQFNCMLRRGVVEVSMQLATEGK